jgi:hypothetical protein
MHSKLPVEQEFQLPKEYRAIRVVIPNDEKASFLRFCQNKLGISQDDLTKELEALGIQDQGIHANYATILGDLKNESRLNNAKGNFGEAKTVWYLSKYEGYFIVQAGWENDPFERATGVDVVGLDKSRQYLSYIESKAAFTPASFAATLRMLVNEQLKLERLNKRFGGNFSKSAFAPILKGLQNRISEGTMVELTMEDLKNVSRERFQRVGVIIHPGASTNHFESRLRDLHGEDKIGLLHPTILLSLQLEDIEGWLQEWASLAAFAIQSGNLSIEANV